MPDGNSSVALRIAGTRADLSGLAAINTTIFQNGALVFVTSVASYYFLLKESTETADGQNVVASATGSSGRWLRMQSELNPTFENQTAWYVDPQNVTGLASDQNDGATATTPILTVNELNGRIGSPSFTFRAPVTTIQFLSDANFTDSPQILGYIPSGNQVLVRGVRTELATLTAAAVQNINPTAGDRPVVQLAAPWAAGTLNRRCRVTVPAADTPVDTIFWNEQIDSGDGTIMYTSNPGFKPAPGTFSAPQTLDAGDEFVVETLTSIGQPIISPRWTTLINGFDPPIYLLDCAGVGDPITSASTGFLGASGGGSVGAYGCDLTWDIQMHGGNNIEFCRFGQASVGADTYSINPGPYLQGCSFQSTGGALAFRQFCGAFVFTLNCSFATTRPVAGFASFFAPSFTYLFISGNISVWDHTAFAVQVENFGQFRIDGGRVWGTSTRGGSQSLRVRAGGYFLYPAATPPTVQGVVANGVNVGGTVTNLAGLPILNATNGAAAVVRA